MLIPPLIRFCQLIVAIAAGMVLTTGCGSEPAPQISAEIGFALGGGINDLTDEEMIAQLDDLEELGVRFVRIDLAWSAIEEVEGELEWERTDLLVNEAAERGMEVLALVTYTPGWARPEGESDKFPPSDNEGFARFSRAAAERYRLDVRYWEIWNEPNHDPFWAGGVDPGRYASLYNAAAAEIRDVVPGSYIMSGGLSPAVDDSPSMAPETFIDGFLPRVDRGLIDAVAIHPYSYPALPTAGQDWNTFSRLPSMKTQIDEIHPGLGVWLTEYGAPTQRGDGVSPEEQAAEIEEAVNCATRFEWAGPLFIYTWRDWTDENFGVVDQQGNPKPAYERLKAVIEGGAVAASCELG